MSEMLDTEKLEEEVQSMYSDVAEDASAEFHFEMGRDLAERLGYDPKILDLVPDPAIDAFAGVGYHFDLANLEPGERVIDLGSGSGMDLFVAGMYVTETGTVSGVDMTDAQIEHAQRLADEHGYFNVSVRKGRIEDLPYEDESFNTIISNGVINLSPKKQQVFDEASRVLKPGGRLAISDIVCEERLPDGIKNDADLWAACIGGAEQESDYLDAIESAGFEVMEVRENSEYEFLTDAAMNACGTYGVKSVSLCAELVE